nr:MAG TPA: hypothetical protein [Caudoviricetes sp.]
MNTQNWNRFEEIHKEFEKVGGADGFIAEIKQEGLTHRIEPGQTAEELTCAMETMKEEADKLGERNHDNLKKVLNVVTPNSDGFKPSRGLIEIAKQKT